MSRFSGNTAVVCVAQFVVVLDTTIVTTALPIVRGSLGFTEAGLSWVITAYTLVFGALLVPCGRLADLVGARRAFVLGLLLFGLTSVACALAWSPAALVGARVGQGLGAALLSPAALALLTVLNEPGPARRRAVGWWTAAAAGGGASGWVLGGVLAEYLGWRSVFWVNVPIVVVGIAVAAFVLPATPRRAGVRVDVRGALLVTAALGLLVYGLSVTWVALPLAVAASALVVRHLRRAADPVVPPWLPRTPALAGGALAALLLTASTTPAMYLATLYVQQVMQLPPARASLLFPTFNVAVVAGSLAGPAALRRWGARRTLLAGFTGVAAGAPLLTALSGGVPVATLLVAFAIMGVGLGGASVASTHAGTEAVDPVHQGAAAGVLSSAAQVGTALGLAVLAPLDGFRAGFLGAGVLALLGLATARLLPGRSVADARMATCRAP